MGVGVGLGPPGGGSGEKQQAEWVAPAESVLRPKGSGAHRLDGVTELVLAGGVDLDRDGAVVEGVLVVRAVDGVFAAGVKSRAIAVNQAVTARSDDSAPPVVGTVL